MNYWTQHIEIRIAGRTEEAKAAQRLCLGWNATLENGGSGQNQKTVASGPCVYCPKPVAHVLIILPLPLSRFLRDLPDADRKTGATWHVPFRLTALCPS